MTSISIEGVSKRFGNRWAVRELDLAIEAGETFVIVGASGCGKTTTLRMINRLVEPDSGTITLDGRDVSSVEPWKLRRSIGYVIQDVGLFAHYTVRRNVGVVAELLGWEEKRIASRVDELLELMGLDPAEFGERYPHELSGGQRQRVGVARALAADPPVVLLDEPFGALDPITREQIQDEFARISRELGKTFVLITHDVFEAVRLGDRIAVMNEGRLLQCAEPAEIVAAPEDEFVEAMLGRHRYQLKLMTTRLGRVAASGAPEGHVVELGASDTVWDALDRLESERADGVRIVGDGDARVATREALLDAVRS